jgi:hypothetical protein
VRSVGVVVDPPFFDEPARHRQACEQMFFEALVAQPTDERFNEAILHRLASCVVVPLGPTFLLPSKDGVRGQLGAVVADDHVGVSGDIVFKLNVEVDKSGYLEPIVTNAVLLIQEL